MLSASTCAHIEPGPLGTIAFGHVSDKDRIQEREDVRQIGASGQADVHPIARLRRARCGRRGPRAADRKACR